MIQIQSFTFNPFQENSYVLYDETGECVIIDPGCFDEDEKADLKAFIYSNELKPVKLLNTHCHIDHVLGNKFITNEFGLYPIIHEKDLPTLTEMTPLASKMYGIPYETSSLPKEFLTEGEVITFGKSALTVIFTPGHAPGHVVFYNQEQQFLINGDVLFNGSIGRTDLPNCNHQDLIDSIQKKLYTLPDEVVVYTGHGEPTTIGKEKRSNPFVRG